jgi:integrase
MSITKTKEGKWIVRWRELGEHRQKTFPKRHLADDFQLRLKNSKFPQANKDRVRFSEFLKEWQSKYAITRVGSTNLNDGYVITKHILPAFGSYRMADITPYHIDGFKAQLIEQGLAPKSVNNYLGSLKQMFEIAVKWRYLSENPALGIERVKGQKTEMKFWSFEEKAKFLAYAKDIEGTLYDVVAFAVNTGMRKGEISGLMRDAVDLDRDEILVKRSFSFHETKLVERTKGKDFRRIGINKTVREILVRRCFRDKVFGDVTNIHQFGQFYLRPHCIKAGVTPIRFHDLRHTFISHLAMLGVPAIEIQAIAGHKRLETTERYMHLSPGRNSLVTTLLDSDVREMYARSDETKKPGGKTLKNKVVTAGKRNGPTWNRTSFRVLK